MLRNPEVNCLASNGHDEPYNDNLCLVRAIALHLYQSIDVEPNAIKIVHNFVTASGCDPKHFSGVSIDQIPINEELKNKIFSSMILTLKLAKLLLNLFDGALKDMIKTSNCFGKTTLFVMLMISTNSSRSFVVRAVMSFSTILETSIVT